MSFTNDDEIRNCECVWLEQRFVLGAREVASRYFRLISTKFTTRGTWVWEEALSFVALCSD